MGREAGVSGPPAIDAVLHDTHTIAVLGAHHETGRAAFYVPEYMHAQGYRILPVNPALAGRELFGEAVVATLGDLHEPVDLVNVFRRSDHLPAHLAELLALRPKAVWLQLGVRHAAVAGALRAAGITVIEDRCLMVDHRRWTATRRGTTGGGG